jgi:nitroimidazol reductase NimA-like FMN-containing flavoprotein (pyridoxamine 5'-phosphate oxidase superfamily)
MSASSPLIAHRAPVTNSPTLGCMTEPRAERPHMPDYGVDTPSWNPLPWSWAAEKLATGRNYWVVTASRTGRPHALPVWGVWDDDEHRFSFSCGPRSRKAANLAANPQAVVAVDDTVDCLSVEGQAAVLDDSERRETWIARYLAKYQSVMPELTADFLRANLVFEFVPERAFAVIEREPDFTDRATKWTFGAEQ